MLRIFVSVLLLLHGIVASYCGMLLMQDATGNAIGLQLSFLAHSPFQDYYYPGMILFTVLGIGSMAASVYSFFRLSHYTLVLITIGSGIIIWILTQMVMIRIQFHMQYVIGSIGLVVLLCGLILHRKERALR